MFMPLEVLRDEEYVLGVEPEKRSVEQLLRYGVVPIDKPCGPSSHEVSAFVRKMLFLKKTGHSGTLDPEVSGVLPVLLENGCKLARLMLGSTKEYVCVMKLGADIGDAGLEDVLSNLRGKIYQTPPLESAVKKALRIREVYDLKVMGRKERLVLFDSRVQGGTYIRRLIRDAGMLMGAEAQMLELRRTVASGIRESQCVSLHDLSDRFWLYREKGEEKLLRQAVMPLEKAVKLKKVVVGDDAIKFLCGGADLAIPGINQIDSTIKEGETVGIYSGKGEMVCITRALLSAEEIIKRFSDDKLDKKGVALDTERVINPVGQ